jgi:hypothetical protein
MRQPHDRVPDGYIDHAGVERTPGQRLQERQRFAMAAFA